MSLLHQLLDFALKSPGSTTKKGLFCTTNFFCTKDLAQGLLYKIRINLSIDLEAYIANAVKLQSLSPTISSNLTHSFK